MFCSHIFSDSNKKRLGKKISRINQYNKNRNKPPRHASQCVPFMVYNSHRPAKGFRFVFSLSLSPTLFRSLALATVIGFRIRQPPDLKRPSSQPHAYLCEQPQSHQSGICSVASTLSTIVESQRCEPIPFHNYFNCKPAGSFFIIIIYYYAAAATTTTSNLQLDGPFSWWIYPSCL